MLIQVPDQGEKWVAYSVNERGESAGFVVRVVSRSDLARLAQQYVDMIRAGSVDAPGYPPDCIEKGVRVVWRREFVPRLDPNPAIQAGS